MSNKPKIYANCKAGCLWETVHKDDFQRSAGFIRQNVTDNGTFKEFTLEAGQTCILKGDIFEDTTAGRSCKVSYEIRDINNNVYKGPYTLLCSRFDTFIRLKHCGTYEEEDGTYTIYYEMQELTYDSATGEWSTKVYQTFEGLPDSQIVIRLMYVDEVYLVNDAMDSIVNAEEVSV